MKNAFKVVFLMIALVIAGNSEASNLKADKSRKLLDNIRMDISETLDSIATIESHNDWTVYLSKTDGKLVRMGLVIEPSTNTVLSVAADGTAKSMGLVAGDNWHQS